MGQGDHLGEIEDKGVPPLFSSCAETHSFSSGGTCDLAVLFYLILILANYPNTIGNIVI
jgi:hypothetical protein